GDACFKESIDAGQAGKKTIHDQEYILLPLWTSDPSLSKDLKNTEDYAGKKVTEDSENKDSEVLIYGCEDDPNMPNLEEIVYSDDDEDVGAEADMTNLDTHILVSPIPTTRIHKDHPVEQIIGDIHSAPQTRRMTKHVTNH
ncbi:hypothetical protein Tco_0074519, partial [Tanacetum coccineum]